MVSVADSFSPSAACVAVTPFPRVESTPSPNAIARALRPPWIDLTSPPVTFDKNRAVRQVWTAPAIGVSRKRPSCRIGGISRRRMCVAGLLHP